MNEDIKCPVCGYVFEGEETYEHVTMWGDGDTGIPKDDNCPACEVALVITENVTRDYEVKVK